MIPCLLRRGDRVDGYDDASQIVLLAQRDTLGAPVRDAGLVQKGDGRTRSGLQSVQQHVRGGHATVQRARPEEAHLAPGAYR